MWPTVHPASGFPPPWPPPSHIRHPLFSSPLTKMQSIQVFTFMIPPPSWNASYCKCLLLFLLNYWNKLYTLPPWESVLLLILKNLIFSNKRVFHKGNVLCFKSIDLWRDWTSEAYAGRENHQLIFFTSCFWCSYLSCLWKAKCLLWFSRKYKVTSKKV